METLVTIGYIVLCVLMFAFAIIIHEFGHFIVALKLGLKVERFSIGFGPVLWKKNWKGVDYCISLLPLGGYVSIPEVDPDGTKVIEGSKAESGKDKDDPPRKRIPAWKELAVAFAGPGMNLVLAVALAVVLALSPWAKFGELPALVGSVIPDGAAEKGGMKAGDRVLRVGDREISTWTDMQTEVQISGGKPTVFTVEGADRTIRELTITPSRDSVTGAYLIMAFSVTNTTGAVAWMPSRNPLKQLAWDAGSIFRVLKGLVTPKEAKATAGALGGPVMIAEGLYRQVRRDRWDAVGFLRFLNVNLAILNLLPIPVLDGGLILFALIALVFRRRVPDAVVNRLSMVFMVLLGLLMIFLFYRDGVRSYRIHKEVRENAVSVP